MSRDPKYLLTNPVEVGSALNELLRGADRLFTQRAGEVLPVYLVRVEVRRRKLALVAYGGERERKLLTSASRLKFEGSAYGTPVEFTLGALTEETEMSLDGEERVALVANFPEELYRMQRREYFRVPVAPPNTRRASWLPEHGEAISFRIQDASLAGVGLRVEAGTPGIPQDGQLMHDVQLDFEEFGKITALLQLINSREVTEHDPRRGKVPYLHLGCIFAEPDLQRESFLQKLVTTLELSPRKA